MRNIKLVIEYDGSNYCGWQSQVDNNKTIQDILQSALGKILDEEIKVTGSGRTDAGVHALAQVANFRTTSTLNPYSIQKALNSLIPRDIVIKDAQEVAEDFNARFNAKLKEYRYTILNRDYPSAFSWQRSWFIPHKLDLNSMRKAGFEGIRILDQTSFPLDVLTINPRVMETIKDMNIPIEELKDLANSVVSVKVEAIKKGTKFSEGKVSNKLQVDIYVPLNACACEWSQFMNRIFNALTPYIKYIKHETKSLNSVEAKDLNLRGNCVLVDGEKKYTSAFALKRDLPKLLKERKLI